MWLDTIQIFAGFFVASIGFSIYAEITRDWLRRRHLPARPMRKSERQASCVGAVLLAGGLLTAIAPFFMFVCGLGLALEPVI